ncbi:MAG: D-glycero-beta-D-manno-heptose-7-phosphate kinase [Elusimicrobiales bacterium]|nr:D-glycero-beta-D-manno-heptose-7-phosphate kinase [Elusimicrobiales bacterium]
MDISSCVDKFNGTKVLVIGDIMLDRFEYGKVERISPEAPVPVFKFAKEKMMLGGAGNVVANLVSLGCRTTFIGIIGDDFNGELLLNMLKKSGAHSHTLKLPDYPTIIKTRYIANNNHLLRADQEEPMPFEEELIPKFMGILEKAVSRADIVLVSDYNKGLVNSKVCPKIIEICRKAGKKVIIDPKGADYSKYSGATLVKPNLKEFSEATGRKYDTKSANFRQDIISGAKFLFEKYGIKNLIVTLSEHGMMVIPSESSENAVQIPTAAREVFDVSGAGDTSLAALGAALGAGVPISDAAQLANAASGIVVAKLGTATVSAEELKQALHGKVSAKEISSKKIRPENKIISLEQAKEIVKKLRAEHKIIGFTNGCFDCCHLGHISSFIKAKEACDVLFVAVNSDASVKRHKGENRPLQDEKTRSMLLASFAYIDYVIIFEEDTALPLVDALRPDIVAKEGYTLDKWPEGRLAESYGGKALTLPRLEGYSTTGMLSKLNKN